MGSIWTRPIKLNIAVLVNVVENYNKIIKTLKKMLPEVNALAFISLVWYTSGKIYVTY